MPEREEIGAVINGVTECLFGRHVGDRADDHAGDRDLRLRHGLDVRRPAAQKLREAEIENLDEPALGAHQVRAS